MTEKNLLNYQRMPTLLQYYKKYQKELLAGKKIIIVAVLPILEDTVYLFNLLAKTIKKQDFFIIGVEYSSKLECVNYLKNNGFNIRVASLQGINRAVANYLTDALKICLSEDAKLLILENGGYVVQMFHEKFSKNRKHCIGAIEETKAGIWKDEKIKNLLFPIVHITNTPLKGIESKHIGSPIVDALILLLKEIGLAINAKNILVIGYGWIGNSVINYLQNRGARILCYDLDYIKNLEAYFDGLVYGKREDMLERADIIIGATGKKSIKISDILKLKDGVFLVSATSRNDEFDIKAIKRQSRKKF